MFLSKGRENEAKKIFEAAGFYSESLESGKEVPESASRAGMRFLLVASIGDVFKCSTKLAIVIDVFGEFCKRILLEIKKR